MYEISKEEKEMLNLYKNEIVDLLIAIAINYNQLYLFEKCEKKHTKSYIEKVNALALLIEKLNNNFKRLNLLLFQSKNFELNISFLNDIKKQLSLMMLSDIITKNIALFIESKIDCMIYNLELIINKEFVFNAPDNKEIIIRDEINLRFKKYYLKYIENFVEEINDDSFNQFYIEKYILANEDVRLEVSLLKTNFNIKTIEIDEPDSLYKQLNVEKSKFSNFVNEYILTQLNIQINELLEIDDNKFSNKHYEKSIIILLCILKSYISLLDKILVERLKEEFKKVISKTNMKYNIATNYIEQLLDNYELNKLMVNKTKTRI